MPKYIKRGNFYADQRGKVHYLDSVHSIFSCPNCDYLRAVKEEVDAVGIRNIHFNVAHPEDFSAVYSDAKDAVDEHYKTLTEKGYLPIPKSKVQAHELVRPARGTPK